MDVVSYKIHVRLGQDEFNGEGPVETVKAAYDQFLVVLANRLKEPLRNGNGHPPEPPTGEREPTVGKIDDALSQIFKLDGSGIVSLNGLPTGQNRDADAALLVMLGFNKLRSINDVPVTKLIKGLTQSGITVERFDRIIGPYVGSFVIKGGQRIGAHYRLNNLGLQKAEEIAKMLFS